MDKKTKDMWLTISYRGTQQTGPAHALADLIAELDDAGEDYTVSEYKFQK